ncbi:DUF2480 family protein [Bacteroidetes bacterium endosymbiont of Geopemphigus sp.]|uniref:DUF2480 family protein n=1 Tax=Bacteroidetes bacterium endosymbiont of Geopemphigus sp. TaxID=2047937 RepID=UPI000CD06347|nr:DUF2480 family protein [Bacteroidetes bacterium endosymbiont of Geopemphigus sp.]
MEKIINKVAQSKLVTIDIESWRPKGKRMLLDLKPWLDQGFVLREKDFRAQLKIHQWTQYTDAFVALDCSSKAIVPTWAYMLVSTYLQPYAARVVRGPLGLLESILYHEIIEKIDIQVYKNARVIIKGCVQEAIPENAYSLLIQKLQPVVHSLMYGKECSTVPLFKRTLSRAHS